MKSFLKTFFASYFGTCFGLVTLTCLPLLLLIFAIVGSLSELDNSQVPNPPKQKTFLVIDISRGFSDHPTFSAYNRSNLPLSQNIGAYGLLDTMSAIASAKEDERICGIFITGSACAAGLPTLEELHQALQRFKSSKKPVFAYLPSPTTADYFLATAADKIWTHPLAEIPLNGLVSEGIYFKDTLEKLGIGIQIVKVGKFKSAVEPLIAQTMSEEDRRQRTALIQNSWNKVIRTVADTRKVSADAITRNAGEIGLYDSELALQNKLIDDSKYSDEIIDFLGRAGSWDYELNSFRQIDLADYIEVQGIARIPKLNEPTLFFDDSQIAVVYAEGEIVDGYGDITTVGGERLASMIRELRNDATVRALVLRINSPGGSVFASEQIRRELELIAKKIPLVVSMGDVAASGGYWISTPAQKIFADSTTVTGSIGVFGVIPNLEKLGSTIGVSTESVTTSSLAELGTLRRPQTPKELEVFQKSVNKIYGRFISLVAKSRNRPESHIRSIAEGRVWDGLAAHKLGLVDEIGGLSAAIEYARKQADAPDATIRQYPDAVNPYQEIMDLLNAPSSAPFAFFNAQTQEKNSPASLLSEQVFTTWKKLRALNDPNGLYARLPWEFSPAQ